MNTSLHTTEPVKAQRLRTRARIALACLITLASAAEAQKEPGVELKYVVIVTRHGVRSPTSRPDQLNKYSTQPWPEWEVPPGYLTANGAKLMAIFGAYDRAYLARQGLLAAAGCVGASQVSIYADSDQRTIETGHAMASGMFPGCKVEQHNLPEGTPDPLFHPLAAGVGHPDHNLAAAAIAGRIGADPTALAAVHRPQLEMLQKILYACDPLLSCPASAHPVGQLLLSIPSSLDAGKGDHLAELKGPLGTAATITENFMNEYANGMPEKQVGWGHVDLALLKQLLELHTASADLTRRTSYLARVQGSNMLSHVLRSLEQAVAQKSIAGSLGQPGDRLLVLIGHDTNLTSIAGALNLSWLVDGRRDDTPPGGALVFELWRYKDNSGYSVRTYYTTQTLEQMRSMTPLVLDQLPARANIFIPGCSGSDPAFSCSWQSFRETIEGAIDPAFVK